MEVRRGGGSPQGWWKSAGVLKVCRGIEESAGVIEESAGVMEESAGVMEVRRGGDTSTAKQLLKQWGATARGGEHPAPTIP